MEPMTRGAAVAVVSAPPAVFAIAGILDVSGDVATAMAIFLCGVLLLAGLVARRWWVCLLPLSWILFAAVFDGLTYYDVVARPEHDWIPTIFGAVPAALGGALLVAFGVTLRRYVFALRAGARPPGG